MDVILLRKLSYKSVLNFGKHAEMSVQQLIDLSNVNYLIWIYYNMEGITFIDDILINDFHLNLAGEKYYIKKPGVNDELFSELMEIKNKKCFHGVEGKIKKIKTKSRNMAKLNNKEKRRELFYYQKGYLQSKNHGH
jgi:hypothetical protein